MSEQNETAKQEHVFIEMEGGLVQNVTTTNPNISVVVVDTDIDGIDAEDVDVLSYDDREISCTVVHHTAGERDVAWEAAVLGVLSARAAEKA